MSKGLETATDNVAFSKYPFQNGRVASFTEGKDQEFPSNLYIWQKTIYFAQKSSTLFGYVESGNTVIVLPNAVYRISQGMYFSIPLQNFEFVQITGGQGYIAERLGYTGFFQIAGEVEEQGRLKYIDGCTDSLLIAPVKFGDPCFNLLYFPPNTRQTLHTHPSVRLGMVASGSGYCMLEGGKEEPLKKGDIFVIHTDGIHAFRTESEAMRVIAYHPDSDFGPTDEEHPMLNRTIVGGTSAKYIDEIRTQ